MKITALAPWFGANRIGAGRVGELLASPNPIDPTPEEISAAGRRIREARQVSKELFA